MLFNKNNNGIDEAKALIPFLYASLPFKNLQTDIDLAEKDIKKLIGKEVYTLANDFYQSNNYNASDDSGSSSSSEFAPGNELLTELVKKIQLPVIIHAYRSYAANNLVSHSDKGRQIIVTETEKPAFEWQIKRDEAALLQKEYKSLDDLIEFLDENIALISEWSESDAYTQSKELFINSAAEFDRIYPIDSSRRLFLKIAPFIREVERKFIYPAITSTVAAALKSKIKSNNLDDSDSTLLEYIKVPLVLLTMSISIKRLSGELLPEGIFQNQYTDAVSLTTKNSIDAQHRQELVKTLEYEGMKELQRLEYFLSDDTEDSGSVLFEFIPPQHNPTDMFFRI